MPLPMGTGPSRAAGPAAGGTQRQALLGATLGLLAEGPRTPVAGVPRRTRSDYEQAAPVLEAALMAAARDPALLAPLSAALGRLGRQPPGGG